MGIPEEQLLREQQILFAQARNALQSSQQGLTRPPDDPSLPPNALPPPMNSIPMPPGGYST